PGGAAVAAVHADTGVDCCHPRRAAEPHQSPAGALSEDAARNHHLYALSGRTHWYPRTHGFRPLAIDAGPVDRSSDLSRAGAADGELAQHQPLATEASKSDGGGGPRVRAIATSPAP